MMRNKFFHATSILCSVSVLQAQDRVAFLTRGTNSTLKVLVDGSVRVIGSDERAKSVLRWLPEGDKLSYVVRDEKGGIGRIVVIDLSGHIVSDVPLRRPEQATIGMRFVENAEWLNDRQIRLGGSVNPRNCEIFSFNIESTKESDGHAGACNSFHSSPDGAHVAYLDLHQMGPDWEIRDSIMLDKDVQIFPKPGTESDLKVLSGPIWSADSRRLAVLAHSYSHGQRTVVVAFSMSGAVLKEVEVNGVPEEETGLTWVGDEIALGQGSNLFIINLDSGTVLAPTAELATRVASIRQRSQSAQVNDEPYRELGARELAVWSPRKTVTAR